MMRTVKQGAAIFSLLFLLFSMTALAEEAAVPRVYDEAQLMTPEDAALLETYVNEVREYTEMDMVVVTSNDMLGKETGDFADEFYMSRGFGTGDEKSGALVLIDMQNRTVYVYARAYMREYLTDKRIDKITDACSSYLTEEDYYTGLTTAVEGIVNAYDDGVPSGADRYDPETDDMVRKRSLTPVEIMIAAGISILLFLIIYFSVKRSYRMDDVSDNYLFRENSKLELSIEKDTYKDKIVTSRIIPKDTGDSDSGSSSSHSSSSGGSYGGGGKSF